jgi:hypothetical protein
MNGFLITVRQTANGGFFLHLISVPTLLVCYTLTCPYCSHYDTHDFAFELLSSAMLYKTLNVMEYPQGNSVHLHISFRDVSAGQTQFIVSKFR